MVMIFFLEGFEDTNHFSVMEHQTPGDNIRKEKANNEGVEYASTTNQTAKLLQAPKTTSFSHPF